MTDVSREMQRKLSYPPLGGVIYLKKVNNAMGLDIAPTDAMFAMGPEAR
jgi:hypothetical protein